MNRLLHPLLLLVSTCALGLAEDSPFKYPPAPKSDQVDNYHGTKVADPYRPLENADSPDTRAWIEAENKLTGDYLAGIPEKTKINERLTALWNYEKYGVPFREGDRFFFSKNSGLQNQSVFFTADELPGAPKVLLDPNALSKDGTVALGGLSVSDDGKLLAYGLASAGSDWQEWKVRDVASGKDLDDQLKWIKFSGATWKKDGSGFFYSRYDEPAADQLKAANYFHKIYFHKVGTPQSADVLVYERPDHKDWLLNAHVSEDGAYLLITATQGTDPKNRVFYLNLQEPEAKVVELLGKGDARYSFLGHEGSVFWFLTNLDAPRARIVAVDVAHPEEIKELVPQAEEKLEDV